MFDGGADVVADVVAGDIGQGQRLMRRKIAQRQVERDHSIAGLTLPVDVGRQPRSEAIGLDNAVGGQDRALRLIGHAVQVVQIGHPAFIVGQLLTFLQHQPAKFFNAQIGDQEFEAGPVAVLLLAQPCEEHARRPAHGA